MVIVLVVRSVSSFTQSERYPFAWIPPIQRSISERLYVLGIEREGALETEKGCALEIGREAWPAVYPGDLG